MAHLKKLSDGHLAKRTSDGHLAKTCETGSYIKSRACEGDTEVDLWFERNPDGTIITNGVDGVLTPLPFYFYEDADPETCYKVESNNTTASTPGTLAENYTQVFDCCCPGDVWVFKWTARYTCSTASWSGPTQSSRTCETPGTYSQGWKKTAVDADGCDYEYTYIGPCCTAPESPPDWPSNPSLPTQTNCDCPTPCDNYCQQTDCSLEKLYYNCPIRVRVEMRAVGTCPGKTVHYDSLDGGDCFGGNCEWSVNNNDPNGFLPDVRIQFHCTAACTGGVSFQRRVMGTVEYSPGTDCDGQTADFVCGDITVLRNDMHDPKILDLYRASSGTTSVGTLWYVPQC